MTKVHTRLKVLAFCAASLTTLPLANISPVSAQITHKSIPLDGGGWFSSIVAHPSGRLYGYGDVYGAFRSDDSGNTWKYLNNNITTDDNFVSGMAVARGNANIVAFRSPSRLFISNDGGTTWATGLSDLSNVQLARGSSPVMYHPANDSDLWMAGNRTNLTGGLWRSTSGGVIGSWSKVGGTTFDNKLVTTIYVHPHYPDQVWVGTEGALYVSTDRGANWSEVWNSGGVNRPDGKVPNVSAIVRRGSNVSNAGVVYFTTNIAGFSVTATNWNNAATYTVRKTLTYGSGWGPTNANVLADSTILSGAIGSGVQYVSSDGGQTWFTTLSMRLSAQPPVQPVWSPPIGATQETDYGRDFIVQDPLTPSRLYVTGGFAPAVSTDWGATWKYVPNNSGLAGVMTQKVNFTRNNPNMALIPGADLGAFVVTDGGASGNAQRASYRTIPKLISSHEIMSSDDGTTLVAAGTDQGGNRSLIMRSTDSGVTWAELNLTNSGLPYSYEGITRSAMTPGNPNDFLVMLGGNGYDTTPRLYRTTNGGQNFYAVGTNVMPNNMTTGSRYHPENAFLLVDGVNTSTRYLASRPLYIYRSTDNGQNWSAMTSPWSNAWIMDLAVDPAVEGKLWAAGGWAGVLTSDNGGASWYPVGSSWPVSGFTQAKKVDAANGQVAVFGRRDGDTWDKIYWSPDNGATWSEATGVGHRYAFTKGLAVDPWVKGKVWISGISVNVISGLPGSTTPQPTPTPTPTPTPVQGNGTGLKGEYYSGKTLTTLVKTQTDAIVNFDWGNGSPSGLPADNYSVRWTGQVQAVEGGSYTFTTTSDDGVRLWVNGSLLIDKWFDQGPTPWSGSISLSAGQKYDIKMEYYESGGGAVARLAWTRPGGTSVIVPQSQLYPASTTTPLPTSSDVTYSFSDMSHYAAVNGVHGGIDFGSSQWGAGNYFGLPMSGWFWDSSVDNRSFTLPSGTRLKSIKLSTDVAGSTWSISDGINPTRSGTFASAGSPITVTTNWTSAASNVKITFSARWDSGIDDIVYGQ